MLSNGYFLSILFFFFEKKEKYRKWGKIYKENFLAPFKIIIFIIIVFISGRKKNYLTT